MSKISKDMNTIELLVAENSKQRGVLRSFLKWFDRNAHEWDGDVRELLHFFDLQEIADKAREAIAP